MATPRWVGAAQPIADVWSLVVGGTWVAGETLTITVGLQSIVITIGATVTTASIATAIVEAWNGDAATGDAVPSVLGSTVPQMSEATASIGATASTVLFKMNTAGVPIIITVGETSASGTLTLTNPTVATGPNFWSNANNWSTGAVPVNGDTVYIDNSAVDILYGLAQSGVTLAAMYVANSFAATIGLPERNAGGYEEYRAEYLSIGATILQVGSGPGTGSGRIKIDAGSVQTALTVFATGSGLDADVPALVWKGTNASNAMVVNGGSVGVAVFGSDVATVATLVKAGGDVQFGAGVTLSGALTQTGGALTINSAVATSLTQLGGQTVINGTGAVAQLTMTGGQVVYNTSGTLGGATVVGGDATLDFSGNAVATAVTNPIDVFQNGQLLDPNKRLGSVVVDLNQGTSVNQIILGPNIRLTRGTPS